MQLKTKCPDVTFPVTDVFGASFTEIVIDKLEVYFVWMTLDISSIHFIPLPPLHGSEVRFTKGKSVGFLKYRQVSYSRD